MYLTTIIVEVAFPLKPLLALYPQWKQYLSSLLLQSAKHLSRAMIYVLHQSFVAHQIVHVHEAETPASHIARPHTLRECTEIYQRSKIQLERQRNETLVNNEHTLHIPSSLFR